MKIDPRKQPNREQSHALKVIGDAIASERGNEQETLCLIATFAICMIRGTYGQEYARDFLRGAVEEVESPEGLSIQLEVRHATRTQ